MKNVFNIRLSKTAAPAVIPPIRGGGGFTLLELLVVITIIGILSALGFAGLMDVILINRAKESAQTMRTVLDRAVAEGKMQNNSVKIYLDANKIQYTIGTGSNAVTKSQNLGQGFSASDITDSYFKGPNFHKEGGVEATVRIGLSGIPKEGYFVACGPRKFCSAIAKDKDKNSFTAYIKRGGNSSSWEAL